MKRISTKNSYSNEESPLFLEFSSKFEKLKTIIICFEFREKKLKMKKKADDLLCKLEAKDCIPFEDLKILPDQTKDLEKLTCPICYTFILNPVACRCDPFHLFGRKCLLESLKTKNECPLSRQSLDLKSLSTPPFELLTKLSKIRVECEFCQWNGTLGGLKYHLKECGGIVIECPYFGRFCQEKKILKKDLKSHMKENLKAHLEAAKKEFPIEKLNVLLEIILEKI